MSRSKSNYIIYLSTDGAGTHLLRSQISKNNNADFKVKIIHECFWYISTKLLNNPNEKNFNKFVEFCSFEKLKKKFSLNDVSKELIFSIFEEIYINKNITFDFSKRFTVSDKNSYWSQKEIHFTQNLLIEYMLRKNPRINIKFLAQLRNPLDHIASLYERFGKKISINEIKNQLLDNFENIKNINNECEKKKLSSKIMSIKFEDLILNRNNITKVMSNFLEINIDNNFYINKISVNKWYSSPYVYKFLKDKELIRYAKIYNYKFIQIPKILWIFIYFYGTLLRNYYELILLKDTIFNNVDKLNPINTKHMSKGILVKIIRYFIRLIKFDYQKEQSKEYFIKIKEKEEKK